ncbi:MAG: insulinase family protein, partial [Bacteroidales bacterium]|nr:insulinase family protein [Bacteroidales bacterium]
IIGPGKVITDADNTKLDVLNEKLGAGSNGILFDILRLQRGYTYGASSSFRSSNTYGYFMAASSVQGSATKESVALFKEIFTNFGPEYKQETLDKVKASLLRANSSAFETTQSLVSMLQSLRQYGLPDDYVAIEEKVIENTSLDDIKNLAKQYLDTKNMIIVVVGDAASQMKNVPGAIRYDVSAIAE